MVTSVENRSCLSALLRYGAKSITHNVLRGDRYYNGDVELKDLGVSVLPSSFKILTRIGWAQSDLFGGLIVCSSRISIQLVMIKRNCECHCS